jgi:hypothetical protein
MIPPIIISQAAADASVFFQPATTDGPGLIAVAWVGAGPVGRGRPGGRLDPRCRPLSSPHCAAGPAISASCSCITGPLLAHGPPCHVWSETILSTPRHAWPLSPHADENSLLREPLRALGLAAPRRPHPMPFLYKTSPAPRASGGGMPPPSFPAQPPSPCLDRREDCRWAPRRLLPPGASPADSPVRSPVSWAAGRIQEAAA